MGKRQAGKVKDAGEASAQEAQSQEEEVIDTAIAPAPKEQPAKNAKGPKMVKLNLAVPCKINDKVFSGVVTVTEDEAAVLIPMAQKKQKADLKIFTGKSFLVDRLVDNSLVIKEGEVKP